MYRHSYFLTVIQCLIISSLTVLTAVPLRAQKKVTPASRSELAGIPLPAGSRKDSRMLSEVSGRLLLELESKKAGTGIGPVEIFYLPPVATSGYTSDSLVNQLTAIGWNLAGVEGDDKYVWLQKDNRVLMAYLSTDKAQTDLYFGEATSAPNVSFAAGNPQPANNQPANDSNAGTPPTLSPPTTTPTAAPEQTNPSDPPANKSSNSAGYTFTITNFDDGWTSTVKAEWVEVTKGNIVIRLYYPSKLQNPDASSGISETRRFYWNRYISPWFQTSEPRAYDVGSLSDYSSDYLDAPGTDRQSGEGRFIAQWMDRFSGNVALIVAIAPDEASFRQAFPKAGLTYSSDLAPMAGRNRFAVGANDLRGTWESGSTQAMEWFQVNAGGYTGYGGTAVAALSAEFNFLGEGKYTSVHKGATGNLGALNTFQQEYKGEYTVSDWQVVATNRFDGKTETFYAWFEVTLGGRILHLDTRGIKYTLVKTHD